MCYALSQGIRQSKNSSNTKSATVDKFITKKQASSVECWVHCDKRNPVLNQRYPGSTTNILKKISNFSCITYIFCFKHHIGVNKIYDKQQILLYIFPNY